MVRLGGGLGPFSPGATSDRQCGRRQSPVKAPWKRIGPITGPKRPARERAPGRPRAAAREEGASWVTEAMGSMLRSCAGKTPVLPPTSMFNARWLLRLVLEWFALRAAAEHPLAVPEGGRWFSEALLPTTFIGGGKAARLSEPAAEVDAVIGHFDIATTGTADLSLRPDATHLVVVEAKIFDGLSPGPAGAKYFDEAPRTVACVAEALSVAKRQPAEVPRLAFYVVAPQVQFARRVFEKGVSRSSIGRKVKRRVTDFGAKKEQWYNEWFQPAFQQMEIGLLSWEELLRTIKEQDPASASAIQWFYEQCIGFSEQPDEVPVKRGKRGE